MIGQTPWTTDAAASMLGCSRGKTTERIEALGDKIDLVAPAIAGAMANPRIDRIASAVVSLLTAGGRIATADPEGLKLFIRGRLTTTTATATDQYPTANSQQPISK